VLAWLLGWGLTVLLLGICPAERFDPEILAMIVAALAYLAGIWVLVVMCRRLAELFRRWAQGPRNLPVVSLMVLLTLWQAALAAVCTAIVGGVTTLNNWMPGFGFLLLVILAVPLLGGWGLSLVRHKRPTGRLPRGQFVALGLMALSAALVAGAFALDSDYMDGECWPPGHGWRTYDASAITNWLTAPVVASGLEYPPVNSPAEVAEIRWRWALWQWDQYAGVYLSPGLSLLLVGLWYAARRGGELRQAPSGQAVGGRRRRWGGLLGCLARSAVAMAACCLLIHLVAAPATVRTVEDDYQRIMAYVRDPGSYWEKVRQTEAAVRADAAAMEDIRASVAQTLAFEELAEEELREEESTDEESDSEP
jgi:hypothetical protein